MRKLFGMGTPRQCEAMGQSALGAFLKTFALWLLAMVVNGLGLKSKTLRKNNCPTWPVSPLEMAA